MKLFLKRLIAYWLDFAILASLLVGLQIMLYKFTSGFPFDYFVNGYQLEVWVLLTMSLPVWAYFILCELKHQKTIGKKILNLRVTKMDGSNLGIKQAFIRTFIKLLPWELTHLIVLVPEPWWSKDNLVNPYSILIPNILLILYIIILFFSKGNLALQDYVAQTRVIDQNPKKTSTANEVS